MRRFFVWLAVLVCVVLVAASAEAGALVVTSDPGGLIVPRLDQIQRLRASGRRVRLRRQCDSACTLYLTLPPGQVCAEATAALRFHRTFNVNTGETNPEMTAAVLALYPALVRAWIEAHGGLTPKLITLKGPALRRLVPMCGE